MSGNMCLHTAAVVARRTAAREEMVRVEKQRLAAHREQIVNEIIHEIKQQQEEWEAAKSARLAALKAMQAQQLAFIGDAQKSAVKTELAERETAKESAQRWKQFASDTLFRQRLALAREATQRTRDDHAKAQQQAIYRREVTRAASRHARRVARRDANANALRRSTSRSKSETERSAARHRSPRVSEFYGPGGIDVVDTSTAADKSTIVAALCRTKQAGPPSATSVVRIPTVVVKTDIEHTRSQTPSARSLAQTAAEQLHEQRLEAGEARMRRSSEASLRGAEAGARLRLSREGLTLLQEMKRIHTETQLEHVTPGSNGRRSRSASPGSFAAPHGVPFGPGGLPFQQGVVMPSVAARDSLGTVRLSSEMMEKAGVLQGPYKWYANFIPAASGVSNVIAEARHLTEHNWDSPQPADMSHTSGIENVDDALMRPVKRTPADVKTDFEDAFLGSSM